VTTLVLSGGSDGGAAGAGRAAGERERRANNAIVQGRTCAWLVRNTKLLRHALSRRMSHMRGESPESTFLQVVVAGAIDIIRLI
jgi:hypothetical protein